MKVQQFLIAKKSMTGWVVKEITETSYEVINRPTIRRKAAEGGYKLQSHYVGAGRYFEELIFTKES